MTGFFENAMKGLIITRKELLDKYPGNSYVTERYSDVMPDMENPSKDKDGEETYQAMMRQAAKLKF